MKRLLVIFIVVAAIAAQIYETKALPLPGGSDDGDKGPIAERERAAYYGYGNGYNYGHNGYGGFQYGHGQRRPASEQEEAAKKSSNQSPQNPDMSYGCRHAGHSPQLAYLCQKRPGRNY